MKANKKIFADAQINLEYIILQIIYNKKNDKEGIY